MTTNDEEFCFTLRSKVEPPIPLHQSTLYQARLHRDAYCARNWVDLRFENGKTKQDDEKNKVDCYYSNMVNVSLNVLTHIFTFCVET